MVHRGPDDEGTFIAKDGGIGLGVRRLSVIDVGGGHQPLANKDSTIWAVLNGEIYNFPKLRQDLLERGHIFSTRSDTEVLVHLYEEHGVDFVDELDGMFACAIWDSRIGNFLVARDRFGEKPLFYSMCGGMLTFASELSALLAGIRGKPRAERSQPSTRTSSTATCRATPASSTESASSDQAAVSSGTLRPPAERTAPYWRPPDHHPNGAAQLGNLVDETAELLEQSVASQIVSGRPARRIPERRARLYPDRSAGSAALVGPAENLHRRLRRRRRRRAHCRPFGCRGGRRRPP